MGRFDPHPKTQGFPWPRASCTRILPHRLAPIGPQDLPSQSEISPASRGTSLRLAPSVRTGADAPRAVTEIAFGLCPATTPSRGCRSVGEVVTKAPANVRPSSPRRSWDTRSALARTLRPPAGRRSFSTDESVVTCRRCQHRPRLFLPWAYSSPSRHQANLSVPLRSPAETIPSPVPSEPTHPRFREGADTSPGFDVCPMGGHCEVETTSPASMGFVTSKSG